MGEPILEGPYLRVQQDTGCSVGGPSCLSCTFSPDVCVWDLPEQEIRKAWGAVRSASAKGKVAEAEALPLIQAGLPVNVVAERAKISLRTVTRIKKRQGLPTPKGPPSAITTVLPLFMAGVPTAQAAARLGKPVRTVRGWYAKLRQEGQQ